MLAALLGVALYGVLALTPLARVVERVPPGPLRFATAEGTLIDGRLRSVHVGPLPLGDVAVALRPWTLLRGRAEARLTTLPPAPELRVKVTADRGGVEAIADGALPVGQGFGMPVAAVRFESTRAVFVDGRCSGADGSVGATLAVSFATVALPDRLGGRARCDGADLLLPFRDAAARAGLDIRLRGDGRWRADLRLEPPAAIDTAALRGQGFRPVDGGWVLTVRAP